MIQLFHSQVARSRVAGGGGGVIPSDIAGLVVWVKADAGVEEAASDAAENDDTAARWLDQSGNGNHGLSVDSLVAPTYKTGILNGLPVVRFDGVDNYLHFPGLSVTECTIFVVLNPTSTATQQILIQWEISSNGQNKIHYWMNAGGELSCFFADTTNTSMEAVQPGSGATGWQIGVAKFNSAPTFYLDGAAGTPASSNGTLRASTSRLGLGVKVDSVGAISVGETNYFAGDIAEVIIYDSDLSDGDRGSIETYLTTKYAL